MQSTLPTENVEGGKGRQKLADRKRGIEEIGIATAHWEKNRRFWRGGKREERQSHGSELLGAVQQKTAFAERGSS